MTDKTTLRVTFREIRTAKVEIPLAEKNLWLYPPKTYNEVEELRRRLCATIIAQRVGFIEKNGVTEMGCDTCVVDWEETDANQN